MKVNENIKKRQKYLLDKIGNNSIAIVFAAKEPHYHRETISPARQDSDFYYLTGFAELDAIAVFIPGRSEDEYILFSQEKNPQEEQWFGFRVGQERACKDYGADQAYPLSQVEDMLPALIKGQEAIYFNMNDHDDQAAIMRWTQALQHQERSGINMPTDFIDISKITHAMRLVKDSEEIGLLRKAAEISAAAHLRAMQACRPCMLEYELEAELMYEFIKQGGRVPSFEPIVAGGANACVLHYSQNNAELKDGDLVLIDAGVIYNYYAGDISRTFPVNGKFSAEQRAIYQAVLTTQLAVIEAIKPGVEWIELQRLSEHLITEQLLALGILKGDLNDLLAAKAHQPFYMHKIGHWLGLDCHDVGSYKEQAIEDSWRKLELGMVLTVEPGIYIAPEAADVDKKWLGIGVRIEDDILVTENGYEVLSAAVPKTIEEIENITRISN
ncbi:MAG: aminopeptidase P N-terminal domain-containing protein [Gammaproteobacteria bacterium]|nr:aminopeptidase P N-terminal domain-containing protein [Gammaproteobacteria bacterium]